MGLKMREKGGEFEDYFAHLRDISLFGRIYKRYISSPILLKCARPFGKNVIEIGSGVGSGILSARSENIKGMDINPEAVAYCTNIGLNAQLINDDGTFPVTDGEIDVCVLDNVLEHIVDPCITLNECSRVTRSKGGLIIAVPGVRGFKADSDHKVFYGVDDLKVLDERWKLISLFSMPFFFLNEKLSASVKQYCLVATYRKVE